MSLTLHELALQYQSALDGLSDSTRAAAGAAGRALHRAMVAAVASDGNYTALEPVILRT